MIQFQYGNILYVPDINQTDLSAALEITLTLTRPHQTIVWKKSMSEIFLDATQLVFAGVVYPGNTYAIRTFEQGDITQFGDYKVTMDVQLDANTFCPSTTACFTVIAAVDDCPCD